MPQGPLVGAVAQKPDNSFTLLQTDADGIQYVGGASTSALNKGAAAAIKTSAGRLYKAVIIAPGSTSGAFTLNDSATTGAAAAANVLWTLPYNGTANVAGAVFNLDIPFTNGLTLSAVPGSGSPIIALYYS